MWSTSVVSVNVLSAAPKPRPVGPLSRSPGAAKAIKELDLEGARSRS